MYAHRSVTKILLIVSFISYLINSLFLIFYQMHLECWKTTAVTESFTEETTEKGRGYYFHHTPFLLDTNLIPSNSLINLVEAIINHSQTMFGDLQSQFSLLVHTGLILISIREDHKNNCVLISSMILAVDISKV